MATWHFDELILALMAESWELLQAQPSRQPGIGGVWQLSRNATLQVAFLEFHIHNDVEPNLIANELLESYGCAVRYHPNIAVHFYKHRKDWDVYLKEFIEDMNKVETRASAPRVKSA